MPLPFLIAAVVGAAVTAVAVAIATDDDDAREERERAERNEARKQADRENERQRQQLEAAEQKRLEQERLASHKKKIVHQTSRLIEKHGLLKIDVSQLAAEATNFPAAAKKTLFAAFDQSKTVRESAVQVRAAQQKLKQTEDLLIMLEGI